MPLQFSIPRRRKVNKLGLRDNRREYPRHRAFVRRYGCSVPGCTYIDIEFAHERSAANSGTGIKPHDAFGRPLCSEHHHEEHQIGADSFDRKHKINRYQQAAWFLRNSPDAAMRESFHALPEHVKRPLLEAA